MEITTTEEMELQEKNNGLDKGTDNFGAAPDIL
jgi:hypothetical protein